MEKLEIKHLAGYFPYGLKCLDLKAELDSNIFTLESIHNCEMVSDNQGNCDILFTEIKPILRPLSGLTKEIEINNEKFVPIDILNIMLFTNHSKLEYYDSEYCNGAILFSTNIEGFNILSMKEKIEKLYEWHFDIHGLIEKGLAIDINDLNSNEK